MSNYPFTYLISVLCSVCLIARSSGAIAQVVPDETLPVGERSQVSGNPTIQIDGGATRGSNLFHSFTQFSLTNGQTAFFNNAPTITNIVTRVTGGIRSDIDGALRANGSANLFLINPSGIVFGVNAQLNLGGSFLATTADVLQFGNQGFFSATNPAVPALLTVNPSALLFNQITTQSIEYRGNATTSQLQVPAGNSLLLIGGNIVLEGGQLTASEGRIELASIAATGVVDLNESNGFFRLGLPSTSNRAEVTITRQALVDVRGVIGGDISIFANHLNISDKSALRAGSNGFNLSSQVAGDITLDVTDLLAVSQGSQVANNLELNQIGDTGNILIKTGSLTVTDNSVLSSITQGQGNSGDITIQARDRILVETSRILSNVEPTGVGAGGDIQISTGSFFLTNGSDLSSFTRGQGNAGNILVEARDRILIDGEAGLFDTSVIFTTVEPSGSGIGGNINLKTSNLTLTNGGQIQALTRGAGDAGDVTIKAEKVVLDGNDSTGEYASAISTSVESTGVGKGGNLRIETNTLSLTNGAQLVAATLGEGDAGNIEIQASETVALSGFAPTGFPTAFITLTNSKQSRAGTISINANQLNLTDSANLNALTTGSQNGGDIVLSVGSLELTGGGQLLTTTLGTGKAGKIVINASNRVNISGIDATFSERADLSLNVAILTNPSSGLYVKSLGSGIAGDIEITAGSISLNDQAQLIAESASDDGGNIRLNPQDFLLLRRGSLISATAGTAKAGGDGGNITIDAGKGFVVGVLEENSDIRANAFTGKGGNVRITAQGVYGLQFQPQETELSDITASSQFGINGTVAIITPDLDPNRGTTELPTGFVDTNALISNSCVARRKDRQGSFVITGAGGLPVTPDDLAASPFPTYELVPQAPTSGTTTPIIEAEGIYRLPNGELVLGWNCRSE